MQNKKEKIAAVVVTYNRKELLKECLNALLKQTYPLDSIIVVDNASTDGTAEMIKSEFLINSKIDYVRLPENTGGTGGFYEGIKRGYEKGFDWLWLMDDDAEPKEDALEILSLYFKNNNIVGLSGSVVLPDGSICTISRSKINLTNIFSIQTPLNLKEYQKQIIEIDMASFVGLLVKKDAIEKIGFPRKEFFIYQDDVEYCIRLRTVGKILLVPKSIIVHKEVAKGRVEKNFLGRKSKRREYNKFWLSYYGIRNLVWLGKKYTTNKPLFYIQLAKNLIKTILGIVIYDDNKYKRIKLVLNAYLDGLHDNFDNSKPKRILYGK